MNIFGRRSGGLARAPVFDPVPCLVRLGHLRPNTPTSLRPCGTQVGYTFGAWRGRLAAHACANRCFSAAAAGRRGRAKRCVSVPCLVRLGRPRPNTPTSLRPCGTQVGYTFGAWRGRLATHACANRCSSEVAAGRRMRGRLLRSSGAMTTIVVFERRLRQHRLLTS